MAHPAEARELILDMWANYKASQIEAELHSRGYDMTTGQINVIVRGARKREDKRAVRKTRAVYGSS